MKAILTIVCVVLITLLAGCMTDREYMLRKANADNQAAHAQTYEPLVIKGPITISEGASITANTPSQPFHPLTVPDGMATQQAIIRDVLTGAVIGYGLHEAGGNSSVKNSHNVPAEVTP
jgi:hypothetical protein